MSKELAMLLRPALLALALQATACFVSPAVVRPRTPPLAARGASDLECPEVSVGAEVASYAIVTGCGRWVRYTSVLESHRGYRNNYSYGRHWLLDSPVHRGIPAAEDLVPPRPPPSAACHEGQDCPRGLGCRIDNGVGQCQQLCRDEKGDLRFCDAG